ncbi:MAG: hypothetical protein OXH39_08065 [Candidatus Poribacteria bacterium]|nr:hypothetical protein [Candidatus Poribacteria bacterium]
MPEPHPICSSRRLVLDDRIIEEVVEAKLTLGEITKPSQNPLFGEDKPWEPRFDNVYANVIYDTDDRLYKCWYNPFIVDKRVWIKRVANALLVNRSTRLERMPTWNGKRVKI